jgi:hypothetical protein
MHDVGVMARGAITVIAVLAVLACVMGWRFGIPGRGERETWVLIGKVHAATLVMVILAYGSWQVDL